MKERKGKKRKEKIRFVFEKKQMKQKKTERKEKQVVAPDCAKETN